MKRICSILIVISLLLTIVACTNPDAPSPTTSNNETKDQPDGFTEEEPGENHEVDYYGLLEHVDSTCFESVGYSESDEVLVVKFLDSGSVYVYYDVPYSEYEDLIYADSIGGYYNDSIKGYYDCKRIE